jgi:hypothetical protein
MRNFFIIVSLILCSSFTSHDEYCKGWEAGYCEGWRYVRGVRALCPLTPICPLPKINRTEYLDGYNRAFLRAVTAANE